MLQLIRFPALLASFSSALPVGSDIYTLLWTSRSDSGFGCLLFCVCLDCSDKGNLEQHTDAWNGMGVLLWATGKMLAYLGPGH